MAHSNVTIPFFVPHLGCPHRCSFCNQKLSAGNVTLPDEDHVINKVNDYLSSLKKNPHIEIGFFGGSFTGIEPSKQEELLGAAATFCKKGIVHGIRVSTRPDMINPPALDLLKKFGVQTIELGVQSFFDDILLASNRGHSAGDTFNAVKLIREYGFDFVVQLMPGLPGDTPEKSRRSAVISAGLNPAAARIYPAVILKGTGLEKMYLEGRYLPLSFDDAVEVCTDMHMIFKDKKIPVIRTGLHPFQNEEDIVAGPYHPSFGFFVKSRMKRDILERAIESRVKNIKRAGNISLVIPEKDREEYIGNRRENILYLEKKYAAIVKVTFCGTISQPELSLQKGHYFH